MTFTVLARDPKTHALGVCLGTGAIAVSSRCPHVRGGVAAISSQCYSNWKLGLIGLDLAANGVAPEGILSALAAYDPHFDCRQVGIVTIDGRLAVHSAPKGKDFTGHKIGQDFLVMGNGLAGPSVIADMYTAFEDSNGQTFEERLLQSVEAGRDAGGEEDGHLSAALIVGIPETTRPRTDLRVDLVSTRPKDGGDAVRELRRLFDEYEPLIDYYGGYWLDHPDVTPDDWKARTI